MQWSRMGKILRKISRQMPDPIKKILVRNGRLLYPCHSKGFIVLAYHSISSKEGYPCSVSSKAFESHLVHIKKFYNVVPVGDIITRIKSGGIFEDVLIALTFDDGFKDNYDTALPLLAKYNIPATIFISTDIIQKNYKSFLSWDNIKEMSKNNLISFGSHGCIHAALTSLEKNDIEYELIFSKDEIESKIDKKVDLFAYPYGMVNSGIAEMVKESGYRAAFRVDLDNKEYRDFFQINRVEIDRIDEGIPSFTYLLAISVTTIN